MFPTFKAIYKLILKENLLCFVFFLVRELCLLIYGKDFLLQKSHYNVRVSEPNMKKLPLISDLNTRSGALATLYLILGRVVYS